MIKAKTSVRLLRSLGFALIAMPEPITTPFGVGLVIASKFLSKRIEANVNKQLRNTLNSYLIHFNRFSSDANSQSNFPDRANRDTQSSAPQVTWQYHWRNSMAKQSPSVWERWRDLPARAMNHVIDMKRMRQRFAPENSSVEPAWLTESNVTEHAIHHTINMERLNRRFGMGKSLEIEHTSNSTGEAIHHSVNMERLNRRFGADDSEIKTTSNDAGETIHHKVNMERLNRRFGTGDHPETGSASDDAGEAIHHKVNMERLYRRFADGDEYRIEHGWPDGSSGTHDAIHHTVNMERLNRRFSVDDNSKNKTSDETKETVRHTIDRERLKQRFGNDDNSILAVPEGPVKHHTVDIAALQRRFGTDKYQKPIRRAR